MERLIVRPRACEKTEAKLPSVREILISGNVALNGLFHFSWRIAQVSSEEFYTPRREKR